MATVKQLLDDLAGGRLTLKQVCDDFASRPWPPLPPRPTLAQQYGVHDDDPVVDPDSWKQVETDPRLTGEQYGALFDAAGPQTRQQ
jgi:hypothetical protein